MSTNQGLRATFLAQLKRDEAPVNIFLVNGIKLHGVIEDYDEEVIILKSAITQMVLNRAISTVVPNNR